MLDSDFIQEDYVLFFAINASLCTWSITPFDIGNYVQASVNYLPETNIKKLSALFVSSWT